MANSPSPTQAFFDAKDGDRIEHWHVTLERGAVKVSKRNAKADAVIRIDRSLLDRIVTGQENAMAVLLRGAMIPEGDPALMLRCPRASGASNCSTSPDAGTSGRLGRGRVDTAPVAARR